jgi:hypothetical protein
MEGLPLMHHATITSASVQGTSSSSLSTSSSSSSSSSSRSLISSEEEDAPWRLGFQVNERQLQWDDAAARQLIKLVLMDRMTMVGGSMVWEEAT